MTVDHRYIELFELAQGWASQSGETVDVIVERLLHWACLGWFRGENGTGLVDQQNAPIDLYALPEIVRSMTDSEASGTKSAFGRLTLHARDFRILKSEIKIFCFRSRILPPTSLDDEWVHLLGYFPLGDAEFCPPPCPYELPRYWNLGQALAWIVDRSAGRIPTDLDARKAYLRDTWRAGIEKSTCARAFADLREKAGQSTLHASGFFLGGNHSSAERSKITGSHWILAELGDDAASLHLPDGVRILSPLLAASDVEVLWPQPETTQPPTDPRTDFTNAEFDHASAASSDGKGSGRRRGKMAEAVNWFERNINSYPTDGKRQKKDWYGDCAQEIGSDVSIVEVYFSRWKKSNNQTN